MRSLGTALAAAGLAGAGLVAASPYVLPASAADCGRPTVVSADYIRRLGGSPIVGSIQLRRDDCSRYWGEITMYQPMPSRAFSTAYITRYQDGKAVKTLSCDSAGGNGRVTAKQTTCRTPKVYAPSGAVTLVASGHEFQNGGTWIKVSWGQTARTR